jgi:hypothetical protein
MFGVDMAYIGDYSSEMNFRLFTNLAEYLFFHPSLPNVNTAQTFYGWILGDGEYFIGFSFGSEQGNRSAPTIDNATLGYTSSVPESSELLLICIGMLGAIGYGWRRGNRE